MPIERSHTSLSLAGKFIGFMSTATVYLYCLNSSRRCTKILDRDALTKHEGKR